MTADRSRRLGRGLDALIPGSRQSAGTTSSELERIPIDGIQPNPFQPRRTFDAGDLAELEASIASSGLLQPITVRRTAHGFELIAGERRVRAATKLGWTEIPAIVREFDDRTMLVLALIENLQRANLNSVEEARGYRQLMEQFQLTQQQVAEAVGKDRTTVTNLLRMLSLPSQVQDMVEHGVLTSGHARALLALAPNHSAVGLASQAVAQGLSVRQLERLVRQLNNRQEPEPQTRAPRHARKPNSAELVDPAVRRIEDDLRRFLQTDVRVHATRDAKGTMEISFYSVEDLDRILDLILGEGRSDF